MPKSQMPNYYYFKCDECFAKWKRVILVFMVCALLFFVTLLIVVATGVDNGALNATIFGGKTNFAQALTKPYANVVGTPTLKNAYNLLRGRGFDPAYANVIGEFTNNKNGMVRVGNTVSFKPDQISVIVNPSCDYFHRISSQYRTGSIMVEAMQANELSFDTQMDVNNGSKLSIMFGNTDITQMSLAKKHSHYGNEFSVTSSARLLTATVDWMQPDESFDFNDNFLMDIKSLGKNFDSSEDRNIAVMKFFAKYGTHLIERAEFGASCFTDVFMESGSDEKSYKAFMESSEYLNLIGSFGSLSNRSSFGVGVSVKSSYGFSFEVSSKGCDGLLNGNPCDPQMSTGIDAPVLIRCKPIRIWDIHINDIKSDKKMNKIRENMIETYFGFYDAAYDCDDEQCNGRGYCVPNPSFWNYGINDWNGDFDDYQSLFRHNVCVDEI